MVDGAACPEMGHGLGGGSRGVVPGTEWKEVGPVLAAHEAMRLKPRWSEMAFMDLLP